MTVKGPLADRLQTGRGDRATSPEIVDRHDQLGRVADVANAKGIDLVALPQRVQHSGQQLERRGAALDRSRRHAMISRWLMT